jgi:hypothetical protein
MVYIEAGILPEGFEIPIGAIDTGFEPMREALSGALSQYFTPVETPEAGDLLLFKIGRQGHLGICLGSNFIHCLRPAGVKFSRIDDATFLEEARGDLEASGKREAGKYRYDAYRNNLTAGLIYGIRKEQLQSTARADTNRSGG